MKVDRPDVILRVGVEGLNCNYHRLIERLATEVIDRRTGTGSHPVILCHGGPRSRDVSASRRRVWTTDKIAGKCGSWLCGRMHCGR